MLEHHKTLHPKPKNADGLSEESLAVNKGPAAAELNQKAILSFTKGLRSYVKCGVGWRAV